MGASELERRVGTLSALPWVDPAIASKIETERGENTPVAQPGKGPHRLTITVPEEKTTLHLGAPGKKLDVGIVGETKHHIHFETTATAPTFINLGCKQENVKLSAGAVPGSSVGYSMVTSEVAYQHADASIIINAEQEDLIARSKQKNAFLQSDEGTTEVNSGASVALHGGESVYISATDFDPATSTYEAGFATNSTAASQLAAQEGATKYLTLAQGIVEVAAAVLRTIQEAVARRGVTRSSAWSNAVAAAPGAVKVGAAVAGLYSGTKKHNMRMAAQHSVCLHGTVASALGVTFASLAGGYASIMGACADVKALTFASITAGGAANLCGGQSTSVVSVGRDVTIDSAKKTSVFSDGPVRAFATEGASMRGGQVALHGKTRAYVGNSSGWGLVAAKSFVFFGKVSSPDRFGSAQYTLSHGVHIRNFVRVRKGRNWLMLDPKKEATLKTAGKARVRVVKRTVKVRGNRIKVST